MSSSSSLRLFVTDDLTSGGAVTLSSEQSRYVVQVMRRRTGDPLLLFNGRDGEWQARLDIAGKKTVVASLDHQTCEQERLLPLTLLFAPIKRTGLEFIVQKATELGVTNLRPVTTAHTNTDRLKTERLTAIAIEAAEQCRRLSVPNVHEPVTLQDACSALPEDGVLYVLDETGSGVPIGEDLNDSATLPADSAAFVIGPEGGFTESELDLMRSLPFSRFVSLGPRILRAETAALAALTCWQALRGDWRTKPEGCGA